MMECASMILFGLIAWLGPPSHSLEESALDKAPKASARRYVVAVDSRLRSAFLLRATGKQFLPPAHTFQARNALLRRHFTAVLQILAANEERGLATALDRLEAFRGETWTSAEREHWTEYLAEQRELQLIRLRLYRLRSLFPQNEHDATRAVPVFVDNYDTACAVGYLMRESGWERVVDQIERENNLVYLTDVSSGPVVHWIAYSGLTQEEAALIQPAYDPPPFDALLNELVGGGSVSHGGLRYENFAISPQMPFTIDPFFQVVLPGDPVALDPSQIGVAINDEPFHGANETLYSQFDDWLFIGGAFAIGSMGSTEILTPPGSTDPPEGYVEVVYSFDVIAEQPGEFIKAAAIVSQPNFHFNYINYLGGFNLDTMGRIRTQTTISPRRPGSPAPLGPQLATLNMDTDDDPIGGNFLFFGDDLKQFAPQKAIHVETKTTLYNDALLTSLTHSFELVPEPAAATFLIGFAYFALRRRKN